MVNRTASDEKLGVGLGTRLSMGLAPIILEDLFIDLFHEYYTTLLGVVTCITPGSFLTNPYMAKSLAATLCYGYKPICQSHSLVPSPMPSFLSLPVR